jgi:opacity protein-like surface antigen
MWKIVPFGVLALVFGNAANAADPGRQPYPSSSMPPPPPLLQSAPLLVDEFGSGWYLRGDIGYRKNKADNVTNDGGSPGITDSDLDKSWLFGAGVGYKWEWFRTDLTVDYGTRSNFSGDSRIQNKDFTAKIDSVTGLVNVYGDLGTWFGLTPYIGLGAGIAHLQTANFHVASAGGPDADSTGSWNFAWAYMAGISYKVIGNSHIDLGYRHVNMGDVSTGMDAFGNQLAFKKMSADELRLGFRYVLD